MPVTVTGEGAVLVSSDTWDATASGVSGEVEAKDGSAVVEIGEAGFSVEVSTESHSVDVKTSVSVEGTPYQGSYEADALFSEQVFPTAFKSMSRDFTVHAINYTEAPNDYGTTLTIGG